MIPWSDKLLNWKLILEVAYLQPNLMEELQVAEVIRSKILEQEVEVEEGLLNKIQVLTRKLLNKNGETIDLLSGTAKNLMTNPICRIVFIQHH